MGYVGESSRIRELLESSKLFLFPSKNEGFARAVGEAMAGGLPCIISDIPNLRELYGGAAILVPVGDYMALATEALNLLSDDEKRLQLSEQSRDRARRFRWEKVAQTAIQAFGATNGKT